jgi:hypothetical protein
LKIIVIFLLLSTNILLSHTFTYLCMLVEYFLVPSKGLAWHLSQFHHSENTCPSTVIPTTQTEGNYIVISSDKGVVWDYSLKRPLFRCTCKIVKSDLSLCHVCLSICPHGTTQLLLDRFLWNVIFEYFLKICQKIHVALKSNKNNR